MLTPLGIFPRHWGDNFPQKEAFSPIDIHRTKSIGLCSFFVEKSSSPQEPGSCPGGDFTFPQYFPIFLHFSTEKYTISGNFPTRGIFVQFSLRQRAFPENHPRKPRFSPRKFQLFRENSHSTERNTENTSLWEFYPNELLHGFFTDFTLLSTFISTLWKTMWKLWITFRIRQFMESPLFWKKGNVTKGEGERFPQKGTSLPHNISFFQRIPPKALAYPRKISLRA